MREMNNRKGLHYLRFAIKLELYGRDDEDSGCESVVPVLCEQL